MLLRKCSICSSDSSLYEQFRKVTLGHTDGRLIDTFEAKEREYIVNVTVIVDAKDVDEASEKVYNDLSDNYTVDIIDADLY